MQAQKDASSGRAHPRFTVQGLCDAVIELAGTELVLPVRNLSAGGFAAERPLDFGLDKSIARGVQANARIACKVRLLGKVIDSPSQPVYRIASHTGFRFEPLSAQAHRDLAGSLHLLAIGASMERIIRPVAAAFGAWELYHGQGPSDLWIAAGDGAAPRVRLSFRDGRWGNVFCRYEDGRFWVKTALGLRDAGAERSQLARILLVLAGAATLAPALYPLVREGLTACAGSSAPSAGLHKP